MKRYMDKCLWLNYNAMKDACQYTVKQEETT